MFNFYYYWWLSCTQHSFLMVYPYPSSFRCYFSSVYISFTMKNRHSVNKRPFLFPIVDGVCIFTVLVWFSFFFFERVCFYICLHPSTRFSANWDHFLFQLTDVFASCCKNFSFKNYPRFLFYPSWLSTGTAFLFSFLKLWIYVEI